MKFKYLVSMRHFMVTLNFIIISFIGAQFLLITQYILNHQLSSELLTTLARVPASPMILFSECIISYGLLSTSYVCSLPSPFFYSKYAFITDP